MWNESSAEYFVDALQMTEMTPVYNFTKVNKLYGKSSCSHYYSSHAFIYDLQIVSLTAQAHTLYYLHLDEIDASQPMLHCRGSVDVLHC